MKIAVSMLFLATILLANTYTVTASDDLFCDSRDWAAADADDLCPAATLPAEYTGPQSFEEIFAGKPTQAAEYSTSAADSAMTFSTNVVSGAIGSIPVVGAFLSGIFNALTNSFGDPDWAEAVEQLYADLYQEVENLRLYVDGAIAELTIDTIKKKLEGIYWDMDNCRKYIDADDMETCTISLLSNMITEIAFFIDPKVPGILGQKYMYESYAALKDDAIMLEHILPMFRDYGTLYINAALEEILSARHAGDDASAISFAVALCEMIDEFVEHYHKAVKVIKLYNVAIDSYEFEGETCLVLVQDYDPNMPVAQYYPQYYEGKWSCIFGPQDEMKCASIWEVGCEIQDSSEKAGQKAQDVVMNYYDTFKPKRLTSLDAYYDTQFGLAVSNWTEIRNNLKSQIPE